MTHQPAGKQEHPPRVKRAANPGNIIKGRKGAISIPLEQRFWKFVKKAGENDCWPWTGSTDGTGNYGSIWTNGRKRRATQVSWEIFHGIPFPLGKVACHSCDNPPCVNPRHIWPGTMKENTIDASRKGRLHRKRSHCKRGHELTEESTIPQPGRGRLCRKCRSMMQKKSRRRLAARIALAEYKEGGK